MIDLITVSEPFERTLQIFFVHMPYVEALKKIYIIFTFLCSCPLDRQGQIWSIVTE